MPPPASPMITRISIIAGWRCARWEPTASLPALAPLHGLEAWSTVMGALLGAEAGAALDEPQRAFLAARRALAAIRARIAAIDAAIARLHDESASDGGDGGRARTVTGQLGGQRQSLVDEERQRLRDYDGARRALAAADATFAAAIRPAERTAADYAAELPAGDALLILCRLDDAQALAIVLRATAAPEVLALPELTDFGQEVLAAQAAYRAGDRDGSLRDYRNTADEPARRMDAQAAPQPPNGSAEARQVLSLPELRSLAQRAFWAVLAEAAPAVTRWHVVSGPGLHSLPLDVGRPAAVDAHYYCGLPAYWRLRRQPLPLPAAAGLDVAVDAAWASSAPIPFVEAELALLRQVFAATGGVQHLDGRRLFAGDTRCPRLQLACHGRAEGAASGLYGVLLLDGQVLDPARASALPGAIGELFASACLAGLVSTTQGGDAYGVVAALQLRGVGAAIACLAPVPDFYMPLLVSLYWHARAAGRRPPAALAEAKRELLGGDWPEGLLAPVHDTYVELMVEVLRRAQAPAADAGNAGGLAGLLGSLTRWLHKSTRRQGPAPAADDALAVARSVRGWLLPDEVRALHFSSPGAMLPGQHRRFSAAWCEEADRRQQLASAVARRLLDERRQLPPSARAAIEHLCAYTVYYGP